MSRVISTRPASSLYTPDRLRDLLSDAETNAHSDWDRDFIETMHARLKQYGMGMHISSLQRHHLERIASSI
ncbi:hypothetical protein HA052_11135 [Chromobacterium haemolyticum]|uniref:Integrase n=1 Tax=Chromobacterium fluminis TaxID=3044269 RepID=A0ABX0L1R3_9NEIS|nr:hypothetical protein [Chromobacterium haemolyticum]NHR05754.1 hypothetical protein [Chromobacterium haemolyticum]